MHLNWLKTITVLITTGCNVIEMILLHYPINWDLFRFQILQEQTMVISVRSSQFDVFVLCLFNCCLFVYKAYKMNQ